MVGESELGEDQADNLQKELESKESVLGLDQNDANPLMTKNGKVQVPKALAQGPVTGNINKTADKTKEKEKKGPRSKGSVNESDDHHEEFLHPNAMRDSQFDKNRQSMNTRRKDFNSCKNCFRRFDELIMKPFFIYRYDRELVNKKAEFMEMFL